MAEKIFKDGKLIVIKSGRTIDDIKNAKNKAQMFPASQTPPQEAEPKSLKPKAPTVEKFSYSQSGRNNEPVSEDIKQQIENLKNDGSTESIILLIRFFSHPKWMARKMASEALAGLGEKAVSVVTQTVFLSQSLDEDSLYWSIRTFGTIGNAATTALITLLNSQQVPKSYKIFIVRSFETCRSREGVNALINCFADDSWVIRREAANALVKMGEMVVPYLKAAFTSGNEDTRYWSVKVLGGILGKGAIEYFKKMMQSEKRDMRYFATAALGEIEDEDALDALVGAFSDDSWLVRAQVSEILEKKGKSSLKILKKVLETGSSDAKFLSIKLMSKVMGKDAIAYISKIAQKADTELKFFALSALSETMDEKVLPFLVEALNDKVWLVRKHASSLLEKYGTKTLASMTDILEKSRDENLRYWTLITICAIGLPAVELLKKLFITIDKKEKIIIIQNLKPAAAYELVDFLFECFTDQHWPIRNEAFKKLGEIAENLFPCIFKYLKHENSDMKYWANQIVKSHQKELLQPVLSILKNHEEKQLRDNALELITSFNQPEVIFELIANAIASTDAPLLTKLSGDQFYDAILSLYLENKFDGYDPQVKNFIIGTLKSGADKNCSLIITQAENQPECKQKLSKIISGSKQPELSSLFSSLSDGAAPSNETDYCVEEPITPVQILAPSDSSIKEPAGYCDEDFENIINRFMSADEKGKLNFICEEKPVKEEKMLKLLVSQFRICNEADCLWAARLIIEWWDSPDDIIPLRDATSNPKLKYWLNKIINHINGAEFL